jgi:hypothetical protein
MKKEKEMDTATLDEDSILMNGYLDCEIHNLPGEMKVAKTQKVDFVELLNISPNLKNALGITGGGKNPPLHLLPDLIWGYEETN